MCPRNSGAGCPDAHRLRPCEAPDGGRWPFFSRSKVKGGGKSRPALLRQAGQGAAGSARSSYWEAVWPRRCGSGDLFYDRKPTLRQTMLGASSLDRVLDLFHHAGIGRLAFGNLHAGENHRAISTPSAAQRGSRASRQSRSTPRDSNAYSPRAEIGFHLAFGRLCLRA